MRNDPASAATIPRWLRFVLISDRAGSSWYVGTGFFFAPVLAVVSPWPTVTAILWVLIGLAGLWLGLLGIAMAMGLAMVLRAGVEIPEEYWWSILDDTHRESPRPRRRDCAQIAKKHEIAISPQFRCGEVFALIPLG